MKEHLEIDKSAIYSPVLRKAYPILESFAREHFLPARAYIGRIVEEVAIDWFEEETTKIIEVLPAGNGTFAVSVTARAHISSKRILGKGYKFEEKPWVLRNVGSSELDDEKGVLKLKSFLAEALRFLLPLNTEDISTEYNAMIAHVYSNVDPTIESAISDWEAKLMMEGYWRRTIIWPVRKVINRIEIYYSSRNYFSFSGYRKSRRNWLGLRKWEYCKDLLTDFQDIELSNEELSGKLYEILEECRRRIEEL